MKKDSPGTRLVPMKKIKTSQIILYTKYFCLIHNSDVVKFQQFKYRTLCVCVCVNLF